MLPFEAGLESVLAEDLSHVVGQLERRADFIRRQKCVATQGREAIDAERGKAAVERTLRNALDAELRWNVGRVAGRWRRTGRVQVVQPSPGHVDQRRREGVCVAQSALLCESGLVTLLESAAIRDTAEDTGDELRVVHQAKTIEQLVLFVEVDVQASIERVAMFEERWRIGEVGKQRANRIRCRERVQVQQLDCIGIQASARDDVQAAACYCEGE